MTKRKISLILISLIAILGGAGLTFYITQLNKTLQATQTELTEARNDISSLETDVSNKEETISTQTTELAEAADAIANKERQITQKEEELKEKQEELDQQEQTLSRKTGEVNRLISTNRELKENTGTVVKCFDGITSAMLADDPAVVLVSLGQVADECEEAAEIVDNL